MHSDARPVNLDHVSVVSLTNSSIPFVSGRTFKITEAFEGMKRHFGRDSKWFLEGLDCEALIPGQEWRKGKIRICFEFCPEDAEEIEEQFSEELEVGASLQQGVEYPLDEIRQMI